MFQTDSVIDLAIGNGKDIFIYLLFRVGITETIFIQHITGLLRQQKTKELFGSLQVSDIGTAQGKKLTRK